MSERITPIANILIEDNFPGICQFSLERNNLIFFSQCQGHKVMTESLDIVKRSNNKWSLIQRKFQTYPDCAYNVFVL